MMKPAGLLSILIAATAAHAAPASMNELSNPLPPAVLLAAAGGHDSVGGLTPLPLWPPYTPRAHAARAYAPAPQITSHKSRKCSAPSCRY
jgi:hypothetical protein